MDESPIVTRALTKRFGAKSAVNALTLQVQRGSITGFLGVNGAGKTTTLRMMMGHLHPTEGSGEVLGANPWRHDEALRRRVAYVSENMGLPGWMTPRKAARFNATIYPQWDRALADHLLAEFDLAEAGPVARLSKGQKRKACILCALCQGAELLILDEPAAGLDVLARHAFLKRILEIACEGNGTVLISSHLLSDLERVVDRLAIIDAGRLLLTGDLEEVKGSVRRIHLPIGLARDRLVAHFNIAKYTRPSATETLITVKDFADAQLDRLVEEVPEAHAARVYGLNLEEIFVELVGPDTTDATELEVHP